MSEALAAKLTEAPPAFYPRKLIAAYPHICEKLAQLWGGPEMDIYFRDLMLDDRGDRHGFPEDILIEILNLRTYYHSLVPPAVRNIDTWADLIETDRVGGPAETPLSSAQGLELAPIEPEPPRKPEI